MRRGRAIFASSFKRPISKSEGQSFPARPAKPAGLPIHLGKRIAERHDALRVKAMHEAEGMADLMQRLLQKPFAQQRRIAAKPQPVKRNDRCPAGMVGHAKNEIQVGRVKIGIRYHEDTTSGGSACLLEQRVGAILSV
jgi:hypothetical protein